MLPIEHVCQKPCVCGRFLAVIGFTKLSSCNIFLCLPISQRIMAQITFQVNHSDTFPYVYITCEYQRGAQNFPPLSCAESPDAETPDSPIGTFQQQVRLQPVVRPNSPGTSGSTPCPLFLALGSCIRIAVFVCSAYCKFVSHTDARV